MDFKLIVKNFSHDLRTWIQANGPQIKNKIKMTPPPLQELERSIMELRSKNLPSTKDNFNFPQNFCINSMPFFIVNYMSI